MIIIKLFLQLKSGLSQMDGMDPKMMEMLMQMFGGGGDFGDMFGGMMGGGGPQTPVDFTLGPGMVLQSSRLNCRAISEGFMKFLKDDLLIIPSPVLNLLDLIDNVKELKYNNNDEKDEQDGYKYDNHKTIYDNLLQLKNDVLNYKPSDWILTTSNSDLYSQHNTSESNLQNFQVDKIMDQQKKEKVIQIIKAFETSKPFYNVLSFTETKFDGPFFQMFVNLRLRILLGEFANCNVDSELGYTMLQKLIVLGRDDILANKSFVSLLTPGGGWRLLTEVTEGDILSQIKQVGIDISLLREKTAEKLELTGSEDDKVVNLISYWSNNFLNSNLLRDFKGNTLMHLASMSGNKDMVKMLTANLMKGSSLLDTLQVYNKAGEVSVDVARDVTMIQFLQLLFKSENNKAIRKEKIYNKYKEAELAFEAQNHADFIAHFDKEQAAKNKSQAFKSSFIYLKEIAADDCEKLPPSFGKFENDKFFLMSIKPYLVTPPKDMMEVMTSDVEIEYLYYDHPVWEDENFDKSNLNTTLAEFHNTQKHPILETPFNWSEESERIIAPCLQEALFNMKVGEQKLIYCPLNGLGTDLQQNSLNLLHKDKNYHFSLELLKIGDEEELGQKNREEEEPSSMDFMKNMMGG